MPEESRAGMDICGHSYVFRAEKWALKRNFSPQLSIPMENAKLHWIENSGMMWDQLIRPLIHTQHCLPVPDVLLVHVGGNYLGVMKLLDIIIQIKKDLRFIKQMPKNVTVVWSPLGPRKVWCHSMKPPWHEYLWRKSVDWLAPLWRSLEDVLSALLPLCQNIQVYFILMESCYQRVVQMSSTSIYLVFWKLWYNWGGNWPRTWLPLNRICFWTLWICH